MPIPTYVAPFTTRGSVRGSCHHKHRTWEAAARCAAQDDRDCRGGARHRPGFGGYSDRNVYDAEGTCVRFITDPHTRDVYALDADGLP